MLDKSSPSLKSRSTFTGSIQPLVLLFLTIFPLSFLHVIFHEGGHAAVNLINGVQDTIIYVHPFSFSGYSRPIVDMSNAWFHAAGSIAGVILPLVIFIPLWKHRSVNNLFLVMLFPWCLLWEGLNIFSIIMGTGDYYNLVEVTGLPSILFVIIGAILLVAGIFLTVSLFPMLGLKPENRNTIWVLPAGMLLWALSGFVIAHRMVPGSLIDINYSLATEILQVSTFWLPLMFGLGIILALCYVTFYRKIYRKLPACLLTDPKELAWKNLRWPAVWFVISVVTGFILIR